MGGFSDVWVPRLVVFFLGLASVSAIIAGAFIATEHGDIPPVISALGSSAISALGIIAIAMRYDKNGNGGPPNQIVTK